MLVRQIACIRCQAIRLYLSHGLAASDIRAASLTHVIIDLLQFKHRSRAIVALYSRSVGFGAYRTAAERNGVHEAYNHYTLVTRC